MHYNSIAEFIVVWAQTCTMFCTNEKTIFLPNELYEAIAQPRSAKPSR